MQEDGVENKEKRGEFIFEILDGSLFAVVGYGGDASLAYLCIEANRAALFHAGRYNFNRICQKGELLHETCIVERVYLLLL